MGIYHPPIGTMAGNTHTKFLDEVSCFIQYLISNHQNLVILGDFNIHTQDLTNPDLLEYNDTVEALGLRQHIMEPTHKKGNTLELIYTESIDTVEVLHAFIGNFILDHRLFGVVLQLRKQFEKSESPRHRNFKAFNLEAFTCEFNNNRILQQTVLEVAYNIFTQELTRILDKIAPIEEKKPKRRNRPWYSNKLLEQRKITRNRERIYNTYKQEHQWKAFTRERNRYNRILDFNKRHNFVTQVTEETNDSKKLFKIINNLLGKKMRTQYHQQQMVGS